MAQDVAKPLREFIVTGFETDTWPFAGKFEQLVHSLRASAQAAGGLVATGTGSGKTESFLPPVLDYCQLNSKLGIKAIFIMLLKAG